MKCPFPGFAARCCRCALFAAAAFAAALPAAALPAQATGGPPVATLGAADGSIGFDQRWTWTGPAHEGSVARALSGAMRFAPASRNAIYPASEAVWIHLRVQRRPDAADHWVLELPMPVLDAAVLHQQDASGRWVKRAAGDAMPVSAWPEAGRYPFFRLQLRDTPQDLFLELRHTTPFTLPLRLATAAEHDRRTRVEYLSLGMAFGALALLFAGSVFRAWRLRDAGYGWYAGYALVSMLAVGAFTGIAAHLLWGDLPWWADAAPGCLALLAGGAALFIVRHLTAIVTRTRWLGRATRVVAFAGPALALLYLLVPRPAGVAIAGGYLLVIAVLSLWAAILTMRRGDPVGIWMTLGAVPLACSVMIAVARVLSLIEVSWVTEYALVLALTLDLPLMLGALHSRSRERRGAQLRELAAAHQDPLTGLLKAHPFAARLAQAMQRYERRGEGAAVAVIEIANYAWIKNSRGPEAAEESLLRAVIRLRKLVRDVDTTGRLGEARFGLILEGMSSRDAMSQLASRLIASGLIPDADHPGDAELHFHVAANLLAEHTATPQEMLLALFGVLGAMSPRTHRPFRFYDPHAAHLPSEPVGDSGLADLLPTPQTR